MDSTPKRGSAEYSNTWNKVERIILWYSKNKIVLHVQNKQSKQTKQIKYESSIQSEKGDRGE